MAFPEISSNNTRADGDAFIYGNNLKGINELIQSCPFGAISNACIKLSNSDC